MTIQDAFNFLLGAGLLLIGWLSRELWSAVKALQENQRQIENDMRSNYARRDDMRDMFNDLLSAIRRIEDKLDGKADK